MAMTLPRNQHLAFQGTPYFHLADRSILLYSHKSNISCKLPLLDAGEGSSRVESASQGCDLRICS
jgi:hypothetical protein